MPLEIATFWEELRSRWQVHLRQHHQLTMAGAAVVQEYKRLRPVRTWLRQLDREYDQWARATTKHLEDSIVVVNYLRWASQQRLYQSWVDQHARKVRATYGFESHRVSWQGTDRQSKRRRQDTFP